MKSDSFTYYEIVAEEIRSGNLQSGVWAKAYADASGVKETAQALYIRYRVAQLAEAAHDQDRATSTAAGSDQGEASSQSSSTPLYFPVSLLKFAMMSIVTFGLYEVHWFYKNWDLERSRTQERLHAGLRAIFAPFFCYSLLSRIKTTAEHHQIRASYSSGLLSFAFFAWLASSGLPDPYWLIAPLSFVPLIPAQEVVNALNRQVVPDIDPNSRFRGWNIAGLLIGGLLLLLAIIGTFTPEK